VIRTLLAATLLASAAASRADEESAAPARAAIAYLDQARSGRAKLEDVSALFPGTTTEKRASIRERLGRLAITLGEAELEPIETKVERDLAAVLVAQTDPLDPSQIHVHAVGLLRREGEWRAAPLPGSFDNTGIRYHPKLGPAARELERWMSLRSARELEPLRERRQAELLAAVREAEGVAAAAHDPEHLALRFLEACARRDLPAALACIGGLEKPRPDDWNETLRLLAEGLRRPAHQSPGNWSLLRSDDALRIPVASEIDGDQASVHIAHFNPAERKGGRRLPLVSLDFELSAAGDPPWRLELPLWLRDPALEPGGPDTGEPEFADRVARALFARETPAAHETPDALAAALVEALRSDGFPALVRLIDGDAAEHPDDTLFHAARLWRDLGSGDPVSPLVLATRSQGEVGLISLAHFDHRRPDIQAKLISHLPLRRDDEGWLLDPALDERDRALPEPAAEWVAAAELRNAADWLLLVTAAHEIPDPEADPAAAPAADAARRQVATWLEAAEARQVRRALTAATFFGDSRGADKLLRSLAQELRDRSSARIIGVARRDPWAGVVVRHQPSEPGLEPSHLLYPVVATEEGPRLLAEATLFHADTRARDFLNGAVWKELERRLPDAHVEALARLLEDSKDLVTDE